MPFYGTGLLIYVHNVLRYWKNMKHMESSLLGLLCWKRNNSTIIVVSRDSPNKSLLAENHTHFLWNLSRTFVESLEDFFLLSLDDFFSSFRWVFVKVLGEQLRSCWISCGISRKISRSGQMWKRIDEVIEHWSKLIFDAHRTKTKALLCLQWTLTLLQQWSYVKHTMPRCHNLFLLKATLLMISRLTV